MLSRYHRPQPPLASFVNSFWLCDGYTPAHTVERHLPNGTTQLIFNLRDDTLRVYDPSGETRVTIVRGPLITGPRDEYTMLDTAQQASLLGIQFKPGGASPFLAAPASELRNRNVPLDALWGAAAHELYERVLTAGTPQARIAVLEEMLLRRLARAGGRSAMPHPAVAFALREFHALPRTCSVAQVTERVGLSSRHFGRVFGEVVGLTPKAYCRVRRFQAALAGIARVDTVPWVEIATSCGYYDQAHFIHDFRAFSGLTPSAYLARRGEHQNHVPLGS